MKSISIVHTGYIVAANTTSSNIAFCGLMFLSYRFANILQRKWTTLSFLNDNLHRATWSVLPWTIFIMSWMIFYKETREPEDEGEEIEADEKFGLKLNSLSPIPGTKIYTRDSGNENFYLIKSLEQLETSGCSTPKKLVFLI